MVKEVKAVLFFLPHAIALAVVGFGLILKWMWIGSSMYLNEFGLDSQGRKTAPRSREQMFMDMEQYGAPPTNDLRQLTPNGIQELQKQQQMQELNRVLQQQQPRSYTRPFEAPTQNQLNNYKQNHPMNRIWDEMKNYR